MEYTQDFVKGGENSGFYIAQLNTEILKKKKIHTAISVFFGFSVVVPSRPHCHRGFY